VHGTPYEYALIYPPFLKGGREDFNKHLKIPLNPPLKKGDLKNLEKLRFSLKKLNADG
jgi:hypothetical protein